MRETYVFGVVIVVVGWLVCVCVCLFAWHNKNETTTTTKTTTVTVTMATTKTVMAIRYRMYNQKRTEWIGEESASKRRNISIQVKKNNKTNDNNNMNKIEKRYKY